MLSRLPSDRRFKLKAILLAGLVAFLLTAALASLPIVVLSFMRNVLPSGKESIVLPNQEFQTALALGGGRLAFVNTVPDSDGVVREMTLTDIDKSRALALEVASVATGQEPQFKRNVMQLGTKKVALEPG